MQSFVGSPAYFVFVRQCEPVLFRTGPSTAYGTDCIVCSLASHLPLGLLASRHRISPCKTVVDFDSSSVIRRAKTPSSVYRWQDSVILASDSVCILWGCSKRGIGYDYETSGMGRCGIHSFVSCRLFRSLVSAKPSHL
jgi:hypothetical protein